MLAWSFFAHHHHHHHFLGNHFSGDEITLLEGYFVSPLHFGTETRI
jgi:hypothetical protein